MVDAKQPYAASDRHQTQEDDDWAFHFNLCGEPTAAQHGKKLQSPERHIE
jgi:hypothetical protein